MSDTEKVFSYTSNELEVLINRALVKALPEIRKNVNLEKISQRISSEILSSEKSEEIFLDNMSVADLRKWAKENGIVIPKRGIRNKKDLREFIKNEKDGMGKKEELELVWNNKYYTDKDKVYIYTDEGIVIAKFNLDRKVVALRERDEETLKKLNLKYKNYTI